MRAVSWIKAARKEFLGFPAPVQDRIALALSIAAAGAKADIAKPLKGFEDGVFEIAIPHRGDAFRAVYVLRLGADLWVVHAFQKKSTHGNSTPRHEIDLVHARIKLLKERLR
jgi:phage-related protein